MRKDFYLVLGIQYDHASVLEITETYEEAQEIAKQWKFTLGGISICHIASRETLGLEEQING